MSHDSRLPPSDLHGCSQWIVLRSNFFRKVHFTVIVTLGLQFIRISYVRHQHPTTPLSVSCYKVCLPYTSCPRVSSTSPLPRSEFSPSFSSKNIDPVPSPHPSLRTSDLIIFSRSSPPLNGRNCSPFTPSPGRNDRYFFDLLRSGPVQT